MMNTPNAINGVVITNFNRLRHITYKKTVIIVTSIFSTPYTKFLHLSRRMSVGVQPRDHASQALFTLLMDAKEYPALVLTGASSRHNMN